MYGRDGEPNARVGTFRCHVAAAIAVFPPTGSPR